jgi:hypothetical protein
VGSSAPSRGRSSFAWAGAPVLAWSECGRAARWPATGGAIGAPTGVPSSPLPQPNVHDRSRPARRRASGEDGRHRRAGRLRHCARGVRLSPSDPRLVPGCCLRSVAAQRDTAGADTGHEGLAPSVLPSAVHAPGQGLATLGRGVTLAGGCTVCVSLWANASSAANLAVVEAADMSVQRMIRT